MPILRNIVLAAAVTLVQMSLQVSAAAQTDQNADTAAFIGGGTDVPLMDGLAEVEGARVVFDKSSGRIIETKLWGRVAISDVRAFYLASLGQLGWTVSDQQPAHIVFVREHERLVLDFEASEGDSEDGGTDVRVLLGPENVGSDAAKEGGT